jgi:hypothetical protein
MDCSERLLPQIRGVTPGTEGVILRDGPRGPETKEDPMRVPNLLLTAVLIVPALAYAQLTIRPGEYEYELQMDLGIPKEGEKAVLDAAEFKDGKRRECITPEDLADKDFRKLLAGEIEDDSCKMSGTKVSGNKLTFTTTCIEDNLRMTMVTEMTFGADAFSASTRGTDFEGRPISMKARATRVGDCPK